MSTQELLHQEVEALVDIFFLADVLNPANEYSFKA